MLDEFDRKELKSYLNQCVTKAHLISFHHINPRVFRDPNRPKPIWKQGATLLFDKYEFLEWYNNRGFYKSWSLLEINQLIEYRAQGKSYGWIARKFGRTNHSCYSKFRELKKRGISTGEQKDQAS